MRVHQTASDSLLPRGVRLLESTWLELAAIQKRRGHRFLQDTVREAVDAYIAADRSESRAA